MDLFSLEQSPTAYRADFALYGAAVLALGSGLLWISPHGQALAMAAWVGVGVAGWSLLEYLLHRFVLHGLQPFSRWHAMHHARPAALICAPTVLSATLFATLVFLPALLWGDPWFACALTLGLLIGYLAYAVTHHATHHWRSSNPWLLRRKHWHALHHRNPSQAQDATGSTGRPQAACFGVTSRFWDRVFGTDPRDTVRHCLDLTLSFQVRQRTDGPPPPVLQTSQDCHAPQVQPPSSLSERTP